MCSTRNNMHSVMNNNNVWSAVSYTITVNDIQVKANIPQKCLKKQRYTGLIYIPKEIVSLLRHPSARSKMELRMRGITIEYIHADSIGMDNEGRVAA